MSTEIPTDSHESAPAEVPANPEKALKKERDHDQLALVYGSWLLRLWFAVYSIQTGLEKFTGVSVSPQPVKVDGVSDSEGLMAMVSVKEYALSHQHGISEGLMKQFQSEPLMIKCLLPYYDRFLGPAFLVLGVMILLGLGYRTSLFLLGLLLVSQAWGLILIGQSDGVGWMGMYLLSLATALVLSPYNRFSLLKKW